MTNIIIDLLSHDLSLYHQADGIIVNSREFSTCNGFVVAKEALTSLSNQIKAQGKFAILSIDRVIEEHDLNHLISYLDCVMPLFDYFIYSDMAVYGYFREHHQLEKLIFDGKTLIASSYDLAYYRRQAITCFLTNELSFAEIKEIASKERFAFTVYGYHQIFYSRRELLDLYQTFQHQQETLGKQLLSLKEELREEYYKIYQGEHGTFIYTPYIYMMFEEIKEIQESLVMMRINGLFLEEESIINVLNCYHRLLHKEAVSTAEIKQINPHTGAGFLPNKSILLKDRPLPRKRQVEKK